MGRATRAGNVKLHTDRTFMPTYTQKRRLLSVSSPLGENVLLLTAFTGREELSRLFKFQLDFVSENDSISPADIVGQPITWAVHYVDDEPRYFHGYVSRFAAGRKTLRGMRAYRAEVVPWLWFLTQSADCRIFQNKTAAEIIEAMFEDFQERDYEFVLTRPLRQREYCLQYRETAFNFVSRLMEEEGIFYFFRHEEGKHTLVLADAKSAYFDCKEDAVEYSSGSLDPNHISTWEHQYQFRPGKWTQTDYNFETPSNNLLTSTGTLVNLPAEDGYEMFDYPGLYPKRDDGQPLTRIRMEEDEAPYDVVTGGGTCCTFTSGGKFRLSRHDFESEENTYVLTSVQHSATEPNYQNNDEPGMYRNTFTCVPASVQFRPARLTPKPFVQGPQTAVVVGPRGEEIYTDKYGRIKVQFFWDRQGQRDENSSVWMRVAQSWAGKRWGASFWPRIGQEVVVDFLEGDPDRPLITGSVYNAEQMPPYQGDGPDSKHPNDNKVSGVKTCSTPGGNGFNEIRFDDAKGKEQLFLRAENAMDVRVGGDQHVSVGHERHLIVKADCFQEFQADKLTKVTGTEETTVQSDQQLKVGGDRDVHVVGTQEETFDALETTATKGINIQTGTKFHVNTDGTIRLGSHAHETLAIEYNCTGTKAVFNFNEICLKAGSCFIVLKDDCVWIQGTEVNINSGGSPFILQAMDTSTPPTPGDPSAFTATPADEAKTGLPSTFGGR
jgi:type VI secretion system secreted protein VgrG